MLETERKLIILFASQTGNSQDVAERICRESKRFYFSSVVKSLEDYNVVELVQETCVVFVCSTTGQGEEPDSMKSFWKFLLRKNLPVDSLSNLKFAVLGLGDSSYTKFNFVAKRLHKRLLQLGGDSLVPVGLGDDQHDLGYDAVADPWIETLWIKLLNVYPLPAGVKALKTNLPIIARWHVKTEHSKSIIDNRKSIYSFTRKPSDFVAEVIENKRITSDDHFQDVRLIKLKASQQSYSPGDIIVLRPRNIPWQVEEFQNVLTDNGIHIPKDTIFKLSPKDDHTPLPKVLKYEATFQQLCEQYFDLMAVPRRSIFYLLGQLSDSELEKEKCEEFTKAEGQEDLYNYINRPKRNIVEVLRDFPHATKNLTEEMLFELLPVLKPREFSIASNCNVYKDEVHILLAVVKYKTKLVKERFGLCSNFLAGLQVGDLIDAEIKLGSFRFPLDNSPIIMVGPGTGIAPFRNYILQRVFLNNASSSNLLLFFGCRNQNKDFLCREELERIAQEDKLKLICAFSRDQDNKVYVQDKILQHKDEVWKLLRKPNCRIFVAGNAKLMPQAVRSAFVDVCKQCNSMSLKDAEAFIVNMEKRNNYQTECW